MKPLYFVEIILPVTRLTTFIEIDRDSNSRASVIEDIRTGQYDPIKIIEVDEDAGTVRDVTAELCEAAALEQAA